MSKDSEFKIVDDVTPETVNPYTDAVEALYKAGPGKAMTIEVPVDKALPQIVLFQRAANALDRTAKVRSKIERGDKLEVTFALVTRHKPRRGKIENAATAEDPGSDV